MRDQFSFISDLTVRGKLAVVRVGGVEVHGLARVEAASPD